MKILFIGGTGNISSECAAHLHGAGHQVAVVTRGRLPVPEGYQTIRADRADTESMRNALRAAEPDVVVDFIAYEPRDVQQDFEIFQGRIQQYIFISSTTVYARPARLPLTEDAPQGNPWWEYARKKIACETWLMEKWRAGQFPVTVVRPSHTYSRFWVPNAISSGSYSVAARLEQGKPLFVHDNGESLWTLTAASDFAAGFAALAGNPSALGESFHITSDETLTWNEIYTEIAAAVGQPGAHLVKVPTEFICQIDPLLTGTLQGDKAHPGVFDNAKIKRLAPGFTCRKRFREGVRESVAWLRAHPERQNLNAELDRRIEAVLAAWQESRK